MVQAGNWAISSGVLKGGTNALGTYGYVYLTNQWDNYSVQSRVQLPAGAFGGGVAGRLNSATGARYAAWVYPEGSVGGSKVLKILKFQNWSQFSVLQEVGLASVGTNWHTLKLVMQGNRIAAHYDGTLMLSVIDLTVPLLVSGGVSLDLWTDTNTFVLSADDVSVNAVRNVLATNDNYSVRMGGTLTVPAPGVLTNDAGEFGPLRAVLAGDAAHGTLVLNTNGSFTYVPVVGYSGTDTFTYAATDGVNTSSPATVTITIPANRAPVATNDTYTLMANTTLRIPGPGVLTNDSDADGDSLTAVLATAPTKGTLNLNTNGGFTYVPLANYVGSDSFTYRASDGLTNSGLATVSLSVTTFTPLFTDAFSRTTLSPWVVQTGNWVIASGVLKGGTNAPFGYGSIYLTNQWSDYSVQSSVQLPAGSFGGGVAGRLNPATGARYAAWVYPEGSVGGSRLLKLLKFQNWSQFTSLQEVGVASVGTNWHTLKLVMQGNLIAVHYDGTLLLSVADNPAQTLISGGVCIDMWTDTNAYVLSADDVSVNPVRNILATNDNYSVRMSGTLTVPARGVLANDAGEAGFLTAVLATNVAHGTLVLNANGSFTYVPASGYTGTDTFAYVASDGVNTSTVATVTITIPVNRAPVATDDSYVVTMNSKLTVAVSGVLTNDTDPDGDVLQALLVSVPDHGALNFSTNGSFVYTPTVGYSGPDVFTYQATDGLTNSSLATVNLSVNPLFSDDFARTNLSPWVVRTGNWALNGGVLQGGTNSSYTYGSIYLTNIWVDYEVQARIRLTAGAFGGGLAGRLTPATGARYAGWIYPEGSPGGSNSWKLLKFQNWESFTVLQQGSLSSVGTNWHTLKLTFQGGRVDFYCDGAQLTSVTDYLPLAAGGLSIDHWTDTNAYVLSADDVQAAAPAPNVTVRVVGIVPNETNGTVTVTFLGSPGGLYLVQGTTNAGWAGSWLTLSTNVAGPAGLWTFTDSATNVPSRFYRAAIP